MIKIVRSSAPALLTSAFIADGVARFCRDGSPVWHHDEIREKLFAMSQGKCAYCELPLGQGAAYLEVEHFFAKKHHPHRVLDWDNLLPACRRCNGRKGDWDVAPAGQMVVDPTSSSPQEHIRLDEAYRPVGLTKEGETTVLEIDLDDILRLGVQRYTLGETFKRKLEELSDLYASLPGEASAIKRRSVVRKVKEALEKCHNDQPLSAVVSTVLMRSRAYEELRGLMIAAGDWDAQLEDSHLVAASASLA